MTESDIETLLRGLMFLEDLPDDLVKQLATISRIVDVPMGTVLFRQGEPARAIYLIVDGTVSLELCASTVGCKRILTVGSGELLGWSPVLEQQRLSATARTITPVRAVEIDGLQAVALCRHDPQFGYELMKRAALALAKRLNATRLQLLDVYGSQMPVAPEERSSAVTSP